MYSLRTLLALASVFFYLRWIAQAGDDPRGCCGWRRWSRSTTPTTSACYMGVIEGLHALIFLRGRRRIGAIGLLALSGLLFMPWFVVYGWGQRNTDPGIDAALPSNWDTLVELGFKYFSQMWPLMIGLMLFGLVRYEDGRIRWRPLSSTVSARGVDRLHGGRDLRDQLLAGLPLAAPDPAAQPGAGAS